MAELVDNQYLKREPFCPASTRPYIWVNPPGGAPPYVRCPNSKEHIF